MTQAATLAQLASSGALTADTSGNVGVGGTNTGAYGKLGVLGTSYQAVSVQSTDASGVISVLASNSSSETRVGSISNHPLFFMVNADAKARITTAGLFQFNSGYGSVATAYGCRAWVNFDGTGTVAIRASGNVSSITDNSVGNYTVNFTTAMPDANYSFVATGMQVANEGTVQPVNVGTYLAGSVRCVFYDSAAYRDPAVVSVAIFR